MRIYKKITDLIGNTPLLKLESIEKEHRSDRIRQA